eukprot:402941-Alexandrium_andersonii.AAC.1
MVKQGLCGSEAAHAIEVLSRLDPRLERRERRKTKSFQRVFGQVWGALVADEPKRLLVFRREVATALQEALRQGA